VRSATAWLGGQAAAQGGLLGEMMNNVVARVRLPHSGVAEVVSRIGDPRAC
jgi:hypothetical protein